MAVRHFGGRVGSSAGQDERGPSPFAGANLLFLHSSKADPYGTHRVSVATYAAAYARRGIGAIVLDITGPDFMARFAEEAVRPDVIGIHCEQSWGLDLAIGRDGQPADVFELLNKPALAHIRDYPFYPWLRARTLGVKRNRLLFFTEKSAVDFVAPFRGAPGSSNHYAFAPHIYLNDPPGTPAPALLSWAARPIDLLYVGSYADPMQERAKFATAQPALAPLLDAVIDAALDDHLTPLWQTAARTAVARNAAPDHASAAYLDLLVAANQFIRNERRRRLLQNLAPHRMHLVWSGPRPDVALHPDTVVHSRNTLPETLTLCRSAKAMAMCLNSFSHSLSERLLSAMERGAAALCVRNGMIDETFNDGVDILTLQGCGENVGEQLARLHEPGRGEELTAAARAKVTREFSPDVRVAQFIDALAAFHGVPHE